MNKSSDEEYLGDAAAQRYPTVTRVNATPRNVKPPALDTTGREKHATPIRCLTLAISLDSFFSTPLRAAFAFGATTQSPRLFVCPHFCFPTPFALLLPSLLPFYEEYIGRCLPTIVFNSPNYHQDSLRQGFLFRLANS
eukprot:Gb_41242 [translate_table: standard]